MKRRMHTPAFKARAVALATKLNSTERAAKRLKISPGLLHTWRKHNHLNGTEDAADAHLNQLTAFAFGDLKARLEGYATGAGVPQTVLTARVARLLLAASRGPVLGFADSVSKV